jgi:hypothetical protein
MCNAPQSLTVRASRLHHIRRSAGTPYPSLNEERHDEFPEILRIWYSGYSPGQAISIFMTDGHGGVFHKSVPVPGTPTDITVSRDHRWLAAIYSAGGSAYVAVFAIDSYGDLTPVATSSPIGVAAFNGVAISE